MRFTVPKFIDYEPKIIGPLTFGQFTYIGSAMAICFFLYFSMPFGLFVLSSFVLVGTSLALAFIKINGRPLPIAILNFLKFNLSSKKYKWVKNTKTRKGIKQEKEIKAGQIKKNVFSLKKGNGSRLRKLNDQIEIT